MQMLKDGSEKAQAVAAQTLAEVKKAMGIAYFSKKKLKEPIWKSVHSSKSVLSYS